MAGYVTNRVCEPSRYFVNGVPATWNSDDTTLSNSALIERYPGFGSLVATVTDDDLIVFNRDLTTNLPISPTCNTLIDDEGDGIIAFFWLRTDTRLTVNLKCNLIYPVSVGAEYIASTSETSTDISVESAGWTLISIPQPVEIVDSSYEYAISFDIEFTNIDGGLANIHISAPAAYAFFDFVNNPALLDLYRLLPEWIRVQDTQTTLGNWQLARFLEILIIHQGEITGLVDDIAYIDISQGKDETNPLSLSTLVEPSVVNRDYILWLAQFTGTRIVNPTTGYTPWNNIPEDWEGIDQIDDDDPEDEESVAWGSLEDFNIEPAGLDEFLRWQVGNGFYGYAAGTRNAIQKSVERVLTGTQSIGYSITTPPWVITVQTLASETPDSSGVTIGDSMPEILELMEPSRPLGVQIIHELVTSI